MEAREWRTVGLGLAIGACYCGAFLWLWRLSLDQWYLPAGLRLGSLLFLPMRYWPYVFAGDAAALLTMRIPKADKYSPLWAYLSPFVFMPLYALVPLFFRWRLRTTTDLARWLPMIALTAAIWTTACAMAINSSMGGPTNQIDALNFLSYAVGDYLGILVIVLPCLLIHKSSGWWRQRTEFARDSIVAATVVSAFYAIAIFSREKNEIIQIMPLILMVLPAVGMTVLHGWPGAAVGIALMNFGIGLALPRTNLSGAFDGIVLVSQTAVSLTSAALLMLGNRISELCERSSHALRAELLAADSLKNLEKEEVQSRSMLRAALRSIEQRYREKAMLLAYARNELDTYRHEVARTLKNEGHYHRAMEAMSSGLEASRALEKHSGRLYPLEIETNGLYAVLTSDTFTESWRGRARLRHALLGQSPRHLSLPLRLAAYRAISCAMDVLALQSPTEIAIRARVWRRRGRTGITVYVSSAPMSTEREQQESTAAWQELEVVVRAYDGALKRRHTNRIGFLISEIDAAN